MMSRIPISLVVLALLVPGIHASALSAEAAADRYLVGPTMDVIDRLPAAVDDAAALEAAEAHAFRGALVLAAEQTATVQAAAAWEQAQLAAVPAQAYVANLTATFNGVSDELVRALGRLQALESRGLPVDRAEPLLVAAHFLVEAEAEWEIGFGFLSAEQGMDGFQHPSFRYTLARPIISAQLLVTTANGILDGVEAAQEPGGRELDGAKLGRLVENQGGVPRQWRLPESGILHRVARHVWQFMLGQPNATSAQVQESLVLAEAARSNLAKAGFAGTYAASVQLDVVWALSRMGEGQDVANAPLLRTMNATLTGADYEAALLESALEPSRTVAPWIIGLAAASLLVGCVVLWRLRGRRHA